MRKVSVEDVIEWIFGGFSVDFRWFCRWLKIEGIFGTPDLTQYREFQHRSYTKRKKMLNLI